LSIKRAKMGFLIKQNNKKCLKETRQVSEYILARNMARFGLKHSSILKDLSQHFSLMFTTSGMSAAEAVEKLNNKLKEWRK